jgi:hypothetical protein
MNKTLKQMIKGRKPFVAAYMTDAGIVVDNLPGTTVENYLTAATAMMRTLGENGHDWEKHVADMQTWLRNFFANNVEPDKTKVN